MLVGDAPFSLCLKFSKYLPSLDHPRHDLMTSFVDHTPSRTQVSAELLRLPPAVHAYVENLIGLIEAHPRECVSVILYGSSAVGGFSAAVSDVDVMLVLSDDAPARTHQRIKRDLLDLETRQGLLDEAFWARSKVRVLADRVLGVFVSHFICPRHAFVAGDASGIFGVGKVAGALTSRLVFSNILVSSITVWGEELRPLVRARAVTRVDLLRSLLSVSPIVALAVVGLPFTQGATKYAMAALKKSLHNCYFCYGEPPQSVTRKVEFFSRRLPALTRLGMLLQLRQEYRPWPRFTLWCVWALPYLHYRAARDNHFPISVRVGRETR